MHFGGHVKPDLREMDDFGSGQGNAQDGYQDSVKNEVAPISLMLCKYVRIKPLWNPFNGRTIPPQGRLMNTTESDPGNTESQPPSTDGVYALQYP